MNLNTFENVTGQIHCLNSTFSLLVNFCLHPLIKKIRFILLISSKGLQA